jgi:hypothetical protein
MRNPTQPTTAQSFGPLLKSARDIMRKYKGLNGDFDRLPMLTWIMFLNFFDDLEIQREQETKLAGRQLGRVLRAEREALNPLQSEPAAVLDRAFKGEL